MKTILCILLFAAVAVAQPQHSATLNWTDTVNPAGTTYNVYRFAGTCASPTWGTALASGIAVKTFVDTPLQPGNFCYVVTAVYDSVESAYSNSALGVVLPWAPTGLDVVAGTNQASLTWVDNDNPAGTTWNVLRATGLCSGTPSFSTIATGLTTKAYVDSTVTAGQYCYQVTATTNGMQSAASVSDPVQIAPSAPGVLSVQIQ